MFAPKIVLSQIAYQKIMHWVNKSPDEVSGMGTVLVKSDHFLVTDVMLLPQKNGAAHTDIEAEDVCKIMYQMKDTPGELQYWWHSHVNMAAFWSHTDKDTMVKLSAGGYFLSTVFNKKGERLSAVSIGQPCLILLDNCPLEIEAVSDPALVKLCDDEYDANVSKSFPVATYRGRSDHYGDDDYDSEWNEWVSGEEFAKEKEKKKKRTFRVRGFKLGGKYFIESSGKEANEDEVYVPYWNDYDKNPPPTPGDAA